MASYETLTVEDDRGVVTITLNRPDAANGMNLTLGHELADAAAGCDNPSTRAVILTGNGRFFSAGGDVKQMAGFGDRVSANIKLLADDLHRAISTFTRMDAVLIVAVNGVAAGAGFSLAMAGDLVLAADTATFTMAYTSIGLSPDGSASYYLPRLIGIRRTQELMFTNRRLSAAQAMEWGLVTRVVDAPTLLTEARELAQLFTAGAPGSAATVKKLLLASFGHSLETQMEMEGRGIAANAGSADGAEGIRAFVEKRRPAFGRPTGQ